MKLQLNHKGCMYVHAMNSKFQKNKIFIRYIRRIFTLVTCLSNVMLIFYASSSFQKTLRNTHIDHTDV